MSESNEDGSAPERLQETRDELTQASIALNTAYDRLQDLRASLRSFTAQRDRLSGIHRSQQQGRVQTDELMGPEHSAIVLSDSEEDSEIDVEALRDSLPSRLLEVTSRWNNQRARLNVAARQVMPSDSRQSSSSPHSSAVSSDELRFVYPPSSRRRRPAPSAAPSSRDAAVTTSPQNGSPARRSILEAHMRQLRRASSPSESSTTLGRRVTQRAAAAAAAADAQAATSERPIAAVRVLNPTNNIIRSTLPLGLEPRPPHSPRSFGAANLHPIESRAATHLRHSLLPNPPSTIRLAGPRTVSINSTHIRLPDRLELRTRARGSSPASTTVQDSHPSDVPTRNSLVGQVTASSYQAFIEDPTRFNFSSEPFPINPQVRMHVGTQDQEQANWNEHMSEADRSVNDPAAWTRPPRGIVLGTAPRPLLALLEPDTDDTIHDTTSASSRDPRPITQVAGVRRRRGWARLDPDGDEISTEDEASFERIRTELRLPRTRNWGRSGTTWEGERASQLEVLDFVHHNSRDATTGHRNVAEPLDDGVCDDDTASPQDGRQSHHVLDGLFHSEGSVYINPLPVCVPRKKTKSQVFQYPKEVSVTMDPKMAGR